MQTKKMLIATLTFAAVFFAGVAVGTQGNMLKGKSLLEEAKAVIEKADADKGGHRGKAIELIDQAIAEVVAGIEYDNQNPENAHKKKKD